MLHGTFTVARDVRATPARVWDAYANADLRSRWRRLPGPDGVLEPAAEGTRVTHTEQYTFLAWNGDGGHDQAHLRGSTQLGFNALAALVES